MKWIKHYEMLDDGTLKSISEKWFKDDMTKNLK